MSRSENGSHVVAVLGVVFIFALAGLLGVRYMQARQVADQKTNTPTVTSVATIESTSDLDTVDKDLAALDVAGSDLNDLDAQLNY